MAESPEVGLTLESDGVTWDAVRVHRLRGREAIGELFCFDLDVVCDPGCELPADALPGGDVTLVVEADGREVRRIHGVLGPIRERLDDPDGLTHGSLRIVPRASRMRLVETQDIYLGRSIPDILRSKLERHDFAANEIDLRLIGSYPARDFVVQYKESDLAFVSRLAEHAGISLFFEHDDGFDKVVFSDFQGGFRPAPQAEEIRFRGRGESIDVFSLARVTDLVPTSFIVQDYNYRAPHTDLSGVFDLPSGNGGGVVEYGAHVRTQDEADRLAKIRAEERECQRVVYDGESGLPGLIAGARSTLVDHPRLGRVELLVTAVEHEATLPVHSGAGYAAEPATYHNRFRAIPADAVFRPARVTPKPRILGFVTGVIQPGPDGETGGVAQLDSEGRYTVQLHFDTIDRGQTKASHAVRMAQPFAGPSYGMHFPLRRGTEVMLVFADGDPDRPVIAGALYNAASPSPVIAQNATKHQLRSSTGAVFELGSKS